MATQSRFKTTTSGLCRSVTQCYKLCFHSHRQSYNWGALTANERISWYLTNCGPDFKITQINYKILQFGDNHNFVLPNTVGWYGVLAGFSTDCCAAVHPPWWCRPLLQRCPSAPVVWCPASAAPPGSRWTEDGCLRQKAKTLIAVHVFIQPVWETHSPSCETLSTSLSLTPIRGGSFLGTSPGNNGICLSSITTPLSAVPFDTAESPRPSGLLPVSSSQHENTILWCQNGTGHCYGLAPICIHDNVMATSICWHTVMNTVAQ